MKDIDQSKIQALESAIRHADNISITAHMRPDGDAVGSCIALYHCISACRGKAPAIVLPDGCPEYLEFLSRTVRPGHLLAYDTETEAAKKTITDSDLIFSLDYNAFHRAGDMEPLLSGSDAVKILIDHHLNPDTGLFTTAFSETEISSTAEYLYQILMRMEMFAGDPARLPADAATALMTGMTTDTNNFANSVYPSTLRMASALLEAGVDRDMIIGHLYNEYREERIRLLGELLSSRLVITPDGVAITVLDKETMDRYSLREGETEGFVNVPLSIGKVRMSCFFKEDKDRIRVSIRSKRGISANRCAAVYFHGGGHEQAAGGRLAVPDDVEGIGQVESYARKVTSEFMNAKSKE